MIPLFKYTFKDSIAERVDWMFLKSTNQMGTACSENVCFRNVDIQLVTRALWAASHLGSDERLRSWIWDRTVEVALRVMSAPGILAREENGIKNRRRLKRLLKQHNNLSSSAFRRSPQTSNTRTVTPSLKPNRKNTPDRWSGPSARGLPRCPITSFWC